MSSVRLQQLWNLFHLSEVAKLQERSTEIQLETII